jgi:hypothetical protein
MSEPSESCSIESIICYDYFDPFLILDDVKLDKKVQNHMPTFTFPFGRSGNKCFVLGGVPWLWREYATH